MSNHKQRVRDACSELGAYEVIHIVAQWMVDTLLIAPHIKSRQDVQDKILACAQEIAASAHRLLR